MPGKSRTPVTYNLGQVDDELHDLTLPSGQRCQARRVGVEGLIDAGLLDSLDELTSLVQTEHVQPKSKAIPARSIASTPKITAADTDAATKALAADPERLGTAFSVIDKLVVYIVVQPTLWVDYKMKIKDNEAKDGLRIETDDEFAHRQEIAAKTSATPVRRVRLEDKMELLNWVMGGVSNLKNFRQGSE